VYGSHPRRAEPEGEGRAEAIGEEKNLLTRKKTSTVGGLGEKVVRVVEKMRKEPKETHPLPSTDQEERVKKFDERWSG